MSYVKRVPELVPEEVARQFHYKLDQPAPIADPLELGNYDGIIFGAPTRFGNMCAQMRNFLDQTGPLWAKNALLGKVGSVFTCTQSQHGGQETTITSFHTTLLHHGMIIVGLPYTAPGITTMKRSHRRHALRREQHHGPRRRGAHAERARARHVPLPGRARRAHRARPRRGPRGPARGERRQRATKAAAPRRATQRRRSASTTTARNTSRSSTPATRSPTVAAARGAPSSSTSGRRRRRCACSTRAWATRRCSRA